MYLILDPGLKLVSHNVQFTAHVYSYSVIKIIKQDKLVALFKCLIGYNKEIQGKFLAVLPPDSPYVSRCMCVLGRTAVHRDSCPRI